MAGNKVPSEVFSKLNEENAIQKDVITAGKLAHRYLYDGLDEEKLAIIERVFRYYAEKAEVEVRRTLADLLKDCSYLPNDIAYTMAEDVDEEVAASMLRMSEVLTDDDLIAIIRATDCVIRQCAVAQRQHVSSRVSDALIDTNNQTVVEHLMFNNGAEFTPESLERLISRIPNNIIIAASVVEHMNIPSTIVEKLIANASEKIQDELHKRYGISKYSIQPIADHTHAMTSLELLAADAPFGNVKLLVDHLYDNSRLSPAMLLTAFSTLKLRFVRLTLAAHAGASYTNVKTLMDDKEGFYHLYRRAGLPMKFYDICEMIRDAVFDLKLTGELKLEPQHYAHTLHLLQDSLRRKMSGHHMDGVDVVMTSIAKALKTAESAKK